MKLQFWVAGCWSFLKLWWATCTRSRFWVKSDRFRRWLLKFIILTSGFKIIILFFIHYMIAFQHSPNTFADLSPFSLILLFWNWQHIFRLKLERIIYVDFKQIIDGLFVWASHGGHRLQPPWCTFGGHRVVRFWNTHSLGWGLFDNFAANNLYLLFILEAEHTSSAARYIVLRTCL